MTRALAFKGAAVLMAGQGLSQILGFGRNIVIAWAISPHDVGVAAALAVTMSLVELLADVSIDKLLIQASDGDEPRMQAASQAAMALRGVVQAVVVFALSWPVAALFELPGVVWAFQCVALGPLMKGFAHLDPVRAQRGLTFMPAVVCEVVPQLLAFAAIWPLTHWLPDFRAVLVATLLQAGLFTVLTHVCARRRYEWGWDRDLFLRIGSFGWPLVINGVLLFAINQGDKVVIGTCYSKEALAVWANMIVLASAPLSVFSKVTVGLALPMLAGCRSDRGQFDRRYELCMQGLAVSGALVAIPLILSGGAIMSLVYGKAYASAGEYASALAVAQAFRVCRIGPTIAALAHGETGNAAMGNAARLIGVAGAGAVGLMHGSLLMIAVAATVGEVASFVVATARLQQKGILRIWQTLRPFILMCGVLAAAGIAHVVRPQNSSGWGPIAIAAAGSVVGGTVLFLCYARLRREPVLWLKGLRGASA
jgi:O-antigen/teichoic acid export membrane protein